MSRKDQLTDIFLIEKDGINKFTVFTVKKKKCVVSVTVEI